MQLNIVTFFKKMLPTFKKNDIVEDMEVSIEYLETVAVPAYRSLDSNYTNNYFNSTEAKKAIEEFYKNLHFKKNTVKLTKKNFGKDMGDLLENSVQNAKYLAKRIDDIVNDAVVSQALTIYHGVLLRSVAHYSFLSKFSTDLLNYLYTNEMIYGDNIIDKDAELNKAQIKNIKDNNWVFAKLMSFYGLPHESFIKSLENIPNELAEPSKLDETVSIYNAANYEPLESLPVGFAGSPIYSIRLMFAQWEADRYRELKDKKKLLELRYLYLQMQKEKGQGDVVIEKEISYLQKRLTDIDYKIAKIERSVDEQS